MYHQKEFLENPQKNEKKLKRKRLSSDAVYVSSEGIFEKKIKRKRLSSDAVYVSSEGIFEKKINPQKMTNRVQF